MTIAAVAIALGIGAVMGVLGGGGSILAVPAFAFVLGLPPKEAIVTSLLIVGFAAAIGAINGIARRLIPASVALIVGGSAIAGSLAGSAIGTRISDQLQLQILAAIMVASAVLIARPPHTTIAATDTPSPPVLMAIGVATGLLTGIAGVGGGFLIVPALVIIAGLSMQRAAAVSMFVIALAATAAVAGYFSSTVIDWPTIVPLALCAAMATLAGARVASRLPQRVLQRAFAAGLIIIGGWMWVRA